MSVYALRTSIAWLMLVLWPLSLLAQDKASAILHSDHGVSVNGAEVSGSSPIFPGDLIETRSGSVANLDTEGSSMLIQPESIIKFQGTFLDLDHGEVSVGTSTAMSVHVKCLRMDPVSNDRTQYDVTDRSGAMHVSAQKKDVNITRAGLATKTAQGKPFDSVTVHEGEEATREESVACGASSPKGPGSGLNARALEIGGGAAGTGLILCILLCKGSSSSSPPVSPSQP
jgi:hypothetical protein